MAFMGNDARASPAAMNLRSHHLMANHKSHGGDLGKLTAS